MSVCELRRATLYDTDAVYALICELKQGQFDLQAFSAGYAANLQDANMHYQLALIDGRVVGDRSTPAVSSAPRQLDWRNPRTGGDAAGTRVKGRQPATGSPKPPHAKRAQKSPSFPPAPNDLTHTVFTSVKAIP